VNDFYNNDSDLLVDNTVAYSADVETKLSSVAAGFDKLPSEEGLNRGTVNAVTDTGAADAYVVTMAQTLAAYVDLMEITFRAVNANTGASTLNASAVGVKGIKRQDGSAVAAGEIPAGSIVTVRWDDDNDYFVLLSANANDVAATEASAAAALVSENNAATSETNAAASAVSAAVDALVVSAVIEVPTENVPVGYLECDGASLLRATYEELFTAIGTLYGTADGTHFNIPDYRGRTLKGWDHGAGVDLDAATRTVPGATGATITAADHVGTEQANQNKAHVHTQHGKTLNNAYAPGGPTVGGTVDTGSQGGNQVSVDNTNIMYCIKYT
jgi:microcystin-dependent protein